MFIKLNVRSGLEGMLVPARGNFLTRTQVAEGGWGGEFSFEEERGLLTKSSLEGKQQLEMWSRD